jgi:hypothetical protein
MYSNFIKLENIKSILFWTNDKLLVFDSLNLTKQVYVICIPFQCCPYDINESSNLI